MHSGSPVLPTLLVIDDDPWIARSTAMVLEAEGFAVVTAADGTQGIARAREARPALILLDVLMPGLDGWETLERLKTDPVTTDVPVIVFSAHDVRDGDRRAREGSASGFVAKPFEPAHLVQLVKKSLRPAADPAADPAV